MHPRIIELKQYLSSTRASLLEAVERVPMEMRSRKPGPGRWSVAEVLEHLTLVERRHSQIIGDLIARARRDGTGPDPETASILASIDMSFALDRSRRIEAQEAALPRRGLDADSAWHELEEAREELLRTLRLADGVNLGVVHHEHPRLGDWSGYEWLLFLAAHERRHTAQIGEIGDQLAASGREVFRSD